MSQGLSTKTRDKKPSFESLVRVVYETPNILQAIALAFDCTPEVKMKSLLLRTSCISETRTRGL